MNIIRKCNATVVNKKTGFKFHTWQSALAISHPLIYDNDAHCLLYRFHLSRIIYSSLCFFLEIYIHTLVYACQPIFLFILFLLIAFIKYAVLLCRRRCLSHKNKYNMPLSSILSLLVPVMMNVELGNNVLVLFYCTLNF